MNNGGQEITNGKYLKCIPKINQKSYIRVVIRSSELLCVFRFNNYASRQICYESRFPSSINPQKIQLMVVYNHKLNQCVSQVSRGENYNNLVSISSATFSGVCWSLISTI